MYLAKMSNLSIVAVCNNSIEASGILNSQEVDIVFSDINMPDLSGIALKKSLQQPPVFIFITSYTAHAVESYEVDAIDFVVKPVSFERLLKATNKAIKYLEVKRKNQANENTKPGIVSGEGRQDYFYIKENDGYTKLLTADILYIESMGDFSKIITINNGEHIVLAGLKSLEKQLPDNMFLRVHKQYISSLSHIEKINANDILLVGKTTIPVSISYRQLLLDKVVTNNILIR